MTGFLLPCQSKWQTTKKSNATSGFSAKKVRSSSMDGFVTKPATCTPQQANVLTESILNMLVTDMRPQICHYQCRKGITQRWGSIGTISADKENPVILAAALDPRYRKLKFLTPEDGIRLQGSVEVLAVKEAKTTGTQDAKLQRANGSGRKSALETLLQSDTDSFSENEDGESEEDWKIQAVISKVRLYFGEATLSKKDDPLKWWSENEGRFPIFSVHPCNLHPIRVDFLCSREHLLSKESEPFSKTCRNANFPGYEQQPCAVWDYIESECSKVEYSCEHWAQNALLLYLSQWDQNFIIVNNSLVSDAYLIWFKCSYVWCQRQWKEEKPKKTLSIYFCVV